jgi:hypothetical protein
MTSTEIATIETGRFLALNQDPGFIQGNLADGEEVDEFSLPRVKIPAGGATTWEVPTLAGMTPMRELEGIVVYFKLTRSYWPDKEPTGTPPTCRSHDSIIGIGDPGGQCRTCPLAQFGSADDGAGQACGLKEIWFLLRPESFLPVVLSLPAMSLKAAKQYRFGQLGSAGVQISSVMTSIKLEADTNGTGKKYSRAVPTLAGILTQEEAQAARDYALSMRNTFEAAAAAVTADDGTSSPVAPVDGGGLDPRGNV